VAIKGKGSVYYRGGDTYSIRFNTGPDPDRPGKYTYTPRKTVHAKSQWELDKAIEEYRRELEENGIPNRDLEYLEAYIDKWMTLRKGAHRSPRTAERECLDVKSLKRLFPHVKIRGLTPIMIKETYEANSDWLTPGNTFQLNKRLRQILNEAVEDGVIRKNPAQKVVIPKPVPKEKDYLDVERLRSFQQLLFKQEVSGNIVIAQILLHTGMRPGEAYGLSWEDIDFKKESIFIRHQYSNDKELRAPKSRASKASVPMDYVLAEYLKTWRPIQTRWMNAFGIDCTEKTPVATNEAGKRIDGTNYGRWFRNFCADNGFGEYTNVTHTFEQDGIIYERGNGYVGLCPNMFRDILPTALIGTLGVDLETASKLLRHEDATVTAQHYVHPIEENQYRASELYAQMLTEQDRSL